MKLVIALLTVLATGLYGWAGAAGLAHAGSPAQVTVAVASNFTAPMLAVADHFERDTGYRARLSFGATGQFYAQIKNGAPFDALLAADAKTPAKLEEQAMAVPATRFTYATGRLVLWSKAPGFVNDADKVLWTDRFAKLAMANPKLAPYGEAARQVLERLGLMQVLAPKIVQGANIGQAFQFVASGNAQLGFVALSQVFAHGKLTEGSGWIVPGHYHAPIHQDAVLLRAGRNNQAAKALLDYLKTDKARQIILSFGYETE